MGADQSNAPVDLVANDLAYTRTSTALAKNLMFVRGPRTGLVRRQIASRVFVEHGAPASLLVDRVAVLAHWSRTPELTKSVLVLIHELQSFGYTVILVSACEADDPLVWHGALESDALIVIRKPNIGYDFGSWSVALHAVPQIATVPRVILANDSMAGPFTPLSPLLEQFEGTRADVWACTDAAQFGRHLQSYFLGFRGGVLNDKALKAFWAGIRAEREKLQIILRNEIGLSRLLREEGYVEASAYAHERFVKVDQNPVIVGWRRLLEAGFPFIKREILRDPAVAPDGAAAPSVLRQLFGVDVQDWVDDVVARPVAATTS